MFPRITPVVKNLLIVNIALLIIPSLLGFNESEFFGLRYIFSEEFQPFQFITYMFFHSNFGHLLSNMFALFIFGPMLERFWGAQKFFLFYMVTGVGAGLLFGVVDFFEMQQLEAAAQAYIANPGYEAFNTFINQHASFVFQEWYTFIEAFQW